VCLSKLDGFEEQALRSEEITADAQRQNLITSEQIDNLGKLAAKHRGEYNEAKASCAVFEEVAYCKKSNDS